MTQPDPSQPRPEENAHLERVETNPAVARVPERVARGGFATGVLVYNGASEFVVDFLQAMAKPAQVTARVVMSPLGMEQFIAALRENYNLYCANFGPPPALPRPRPGERQMTAQEIYADLKVPEEVISGAYANAVMIRHSPAEFHLDFVTRFYPNAAVSSRVFVSPARISSLIDTLTVSLLNWKRNQTAANPPVPPSPPSSPTAGPGGTPPAEPNPPMPH